MRTGRAASPWCTGPVLAYIEQNGVFADQTCSCGRVVYGGTASTTTPGGAQPANEDRSESSRSTRPTRTNAPNDARQWDAASYEHPTLRGSDEDADDSDNDDRDDSDS